MPLVPGQRAYITQATGDFAATNTRPARTRNGHPGASEIHRTTVTYITIDLCWFKFIKLQTAIERFYS